MCLHFDAVMSFQFVTTSRPVRGISTEARSHVMKSYIQKKQSQKSSDLGVSSEQNRTQSRITKLRQEKVVEADHAAPAMSRRLVDFAHFVAYFESGGEVEISTTQGSPVSSDILEHRPQTLVNDDGSFGHQNQCAEYVQTNLQNTPARRRIIIAYLYEIMAPFQDIGPQRCLGSEIDPFHTLPQLSLSGTNVERLKKHCQCFSTLLRWSTRPYALCVFIC